MITCVRCKDHWWSHCLKFGEDYCRWLLARQGRTALSSHGIQYKPLYQANAKGGECAFCEFLGQDPLEDLQWDPERGPDAGFDLVTIRGKKPDVKWTAQGHFLTYAATKTPSYEDRKFDYLVMVRGTWPDYEIVGWLSKKAFFDRHLVAKPGDGTRLDPGTWYMHQSQLNDPTHLRYWRSQLSHADPLFLEPATC